MLNQAEVYQLFGGIDRMPGIMEPRIGRWRAWPMAKMQLFWHLMYPRSNGDRASHVSAMPVLRQRLSRLGHDAAVAVRQSKRLREPVPPCGTIAMMYVPRVHRCPDGRLRDMIYGDLLCGHALALPTLALEQPWPHRAKHRSSAAPIRLDPYQSATELLALPLMATRHLRGCVDSLECMLARAQFPMDARNRRRKILLGLAMFEARRRVFRRLLRRLGARCLVVTYGPGRLGEIAAAREMGISVVEFQHGVMSADCPDYGWPAEYRSLKSDMAVPDCIALFGSVFRREMLRPGFWREDEAVAVGAATMEYYRSAARPKTCVSKPFRVLFMTQANTRDAAIAFWREFAQVPGEVIAATVVLKIHPEEHNSVEPYRQLAISFPDRFALLHADTNPMEAMIDADIVVAYNSLALIEALGLGKPAISICGGTAPAGLAGAIGMQDVLSVVPHIRLPRALHELLRERAGSAALDEWCARAWNEGCAFFSDGFTDAAASLINGAVGRSRNVLH